MNFQSKIRHIACCGIIVMCLNGAVVAQNIERVRQAAEQGDAEAQVSLGTMYSQGIGMPEDDREAAKWYRKAAEQGMALAQASLGLMYAQGDGVPEDDREAAKWYRKAAEQGMAGAQSSLGFMYAT